MSLYLPVAFLVLQALVLGLCGPAITAPAAYILMVAAPLLTAPATFWRGRSQPVAIRHSWYALSWSLGLWAVGAFINLWQEMVLHHQNEMYRTAILAFNLAAVPTTYLLASDWRLHGRPLLRAVDALVALALGCAYFQYTWRMISAQAGADDAGVAYLVWLLDLQNLYIASGALVRWHVAESDEERNFFRAFAVYALVYFAIVFLNDHVFAGNPHFGPQYGSVITLAFALLSSLALRAPATAPSRSVNPSFVRAVRSASPILLAAALLATSLLLIRVDYLLGCAGVLIAVLGIGVRTTLIQVHQIEHREALRKEASELQSIAWTDALTGVPNRHYFTQFLARACRTDRRPGPQAILMIDIDHFKLLNDRYGHPVGDGCLRAVAGALQCALGRAEDVLARYGGEEFIVLLRSSDAHGALLVAERMRAAVRDLGIENAGSPDRVVTVSIGVASAELTDEAAAGRLVEAADRALYAAKCTGRNVVRLATEHVDPEALLEASITARRRRLQLGAA